MKVKNDSIKTAVVGVGHLGAAHAVILSRLAVSDLIGVYDSDGGQSCEVARRAGTSVFDSFEALLKARPDFAVVATPTSSHFEITKALLGEGIGVLVEKPITSTVEEADKLVSEAEPGRGAFLSVGHVERFNPAVQAALKHVKDPLFIECDRVHPFSFRSMDIGVVLDLMIHDIDLVRWLAGSEFKTIEGIGASVVCPSEDMALAKFGFENGCAASVRASRVSLRKLRKLRIFCSDLYITLDCVARTARKVTVNEEVREKIRDSCLGGGSAQLSFADCLSVEELEVKDQEPLRLELEACLGALRNGERPPVSATEGRRALAAAFEVGNGIRRHQDSVKKGRRNG